jgi:hypothetical protein
MYLETRYTLAFFAGAIANVFGMSASGSVGMFAIITLPMVSGIGLPAVWSGGTENGVDELGPDSVGEQLTLARGLEIPLKKEHHGSQRII